MLNDHLVDAWFWLEMARLDVVAWLRACWRRFIVGLGVWLINVLAALGSLGARRKR